MLTHERGSTISGQPEARSMYNTVRMSYCWPHIANDVYTYVRQGWSCRRHQRTFMHQSLLQLFPPKGSLELVVMNNAGLFLKTTTGIKYIVVMTDYYSKLTRVIPSRTTAATDIVHTFINDWVIPYGKPELWLANNGPRFIWNFFNTACVALGTKLMTTATHHPQEYRQT